MVVVRIDDRSPSCKIGQDVDPPVADPKTPGLAIVPVRRERRIANEIVRRRGLRQWRAQGGGPGGVVRGCPCLAIQKIGDRAADQGGRSRANQYLPSVHRQSPGTRRCSRSG